MPINKNIYNLNFNKLVSWLITSQLFEPKMYKWCRALVLPLNSSLSNLMAFRKQRLYNLSITPQVFSLECMLNNKFDSTLRRIFISDGENDKKLFVYRRLENVPMITHTTAEAIPQFIYKKNELTTTVAHFVVNVPASLTIDLNVLKSVLNTYKLPDKNYKILLF
jgi:hypothetical protein